MIYIIFRLSNKIVLVCNRTGQGFSLVRLSYWTTPKSGSSGQTMIMYKWGKEREWVFDSGREVYLSVCEREREK